VAMTGTMDFALDDNAITVVAVMAVDKEGQKASDEEEDDIPGLLLVTY
jgi:hypothetical protein